MGLSKRWTVRKRHGRWAVYDRDVCWDHFDTLTEAHTWATQCAISDTLHSPGGLTLLRYLQSSARYRHG